MNMCISTDGFLESLKASSIGELEDKMTDEPKKELFVLRNRQFKLVTIF